MRKTGYFRKRIQKAASMMLAGALCMSALAGCDKKPDPETTAAEVTTTQAGETTASPAQSTAAVTTPATTTAAPTQAPTTAVPEMKDGEIIELSPFPEAKIPDTEAIRFVQNLEVGWNLGNTFDAYSGGTGLALESAWVGVKTSEKLIQVVYDAGFRTIRIPVSWHGHMDEETQKIDEAWLNRVKEVVDWSLNAGLYVIINIHHDNEKNAKGLYLYPSYDELENSKKYVTSVWSQLAEAFADYDERLVFETMNEPRQVGTDHEWWVAAASEAGKECIDCVNQLNQTCVDAIRAQGSEANRKRYILVPGYCASPDLEVTAAFKLPTDEQALKENLILLSVHAYRPYNFALAGSNEKSSTDKFSITKASDRKDIDDFMKAVYSKFVSQGVGCVITEYGARLKKDNDRARAEFAAYYVAEARNYGMTTVWWDNHIFSGSGEIFGLINRNSCYVIYPSIVDQLIYYSKPENAPVAENKAA